MKRFALALILLAMPAAASATGGLTAAPPALRPVEVALGFGHVAGSALILDPPDRWQAQGPGAGARNGGSTIASCALDPDRPAGAAAAKCIVKAKRNGRTYDGDLWRGGKRHWVRCRES